VSSLAFGRYRAVELDEVPREYLEYIRAQDWLYPSTRAELEEELERRAAERPDSRHGREWPGLRPQDPADAERLERHRWQRSSLGYRSRWVAGKKRPGWCCYQISPRLALVIQDWLDGRAKPAKRRAA
jgi:hypothetical protein